MYNRMTDCCRNLFVILTIYLMRLPSVHSSFQYVQYSEPTVYKPFWKFSSFMDNNLEYHCYQKCIPTIVSSPAIMVEMCNKICPFRTDIAACTECPRIMQIIAQGGAGVPVTEPEAVSIEPQTHSIIFKPEIISMGKVQKQCCYLDQCEVVPYDFRCDTRCYEPCDQVCTGRCFVNPQCPNKCLEIRIHLFKIKYQIWLANKLNEIKLKYRQMAEACIMKTKMALESEVGSMHSVAQQVFTGNVQVLSPGIMAEVETIPNSVIADASNKIIEQHSMMPMAQVSQQIIPISGTAADIQEMSMGGPMGLQDSNDDNPPSPYSDSDPQQQSGDAVRRYYY